MHSIAHAVALRLFFFNQRKFLYFLILTVCSPPWFYCAEITFQLSNLWHTPCLIGPGSKKYLRSKEKIMQSHRALCTIVCLMVMVGVFVTCPLPGTLISQASAKEVPNSRKIISDTLAAHKVTCLSRDGVIQTVLLDGKWIDVKDVELIDHTLIIRTDSGSISLTAVLSSQ